MDQHTNAIDGDELRELFLAGTRCLELHADAINALNVFPVPDGDTGINMLLTLRAANASPDIPASGGTVAEVGHGLARGALLGARGNSGVIFSQFMTGFSQGLAGLDSCDGAALGHAFGLASEASYRAVGKPVEGTMLTVMRAAAEASAGLDGPAAQVMRVAYEAAETALAGTPSLLPVLKQAGVVDAGGQGVVAFLAGATGHLEGVPINLTITAPAAVDGPSTVSHDFLEHTEEEMYGYCTQFIVHGQKMDLDTVREKVLALAASTVVIGDDRTVRVHAHTEDPGPLLTLGASLGALDEINIQNMDMQHQEFMARHGYVGDPVDFGVIAVAPGDGIAAVFRDLGAVGIVSGGQTMNPSAAGLVDEVKRSGARHAVILPNNKNIVMAAQQAAQLSDATITVVPSTSIPQGIAAILAVNPEHTDDANLAAMNAALSSVHSGEVTVAVRSTSIDGVDVAEGQAIGLLDGHLVCACGTPSEAVVELVARAEPENDALVTLYTGAGVPGSDARSTATAIGQRFPSLETEIVPGGQPHYQYLISIE